MLPFTVPAKFNSIDLLPCPPSPSADTFIAGRTPNISTNVSRTLTAFFHAFLICFSSYTTFLCNFVLPFWDSSLHFSASATYRTFLRSMTENTIIRDHTLAMTNRTRLSMRTATEFADNFSCAATMSACRTIRLSPSKKFPPFLSP